ncbi:hypothetical protein V491_00810 [Pseudogymnoascus sp. VKM F-3775]|nr:hypothetical protein V491_00810 [Pseudogymnoascus sp. VKM F-3775]
MTPPHPRRSLKTTSSSPMTPRSATSASTLDTISMTPHKLRKGATFHNPPSPVSDHFVVPCLPRRSQTSLEDVVEAHKRRVALALGDIDRGLSAVDLGAPHPTTQSFRDDSLPVPQGFLNHTVDTNRRETRYTMSPIASQSDFSIGGRSLRPRRQHRRQSSHHASDSGLGSSIMSASEKRGVAAAASAMVVGIEVRGSESGAWEPRDNLILYPHKPWGTEPKMWGWSMGSPTSRALNRQFQHLQSRALPRRTAHRKTPSRVLASARRTESMSLS